jgi:anti-anti-sigma regulatory factor
MTAALDLPARLDTGAVCGFAEALRGLRGADLDIDGRACSMIGALGLQTLLVAEATWRHDGRRLCLRNLPDDTARQIALMGIDPATLADGHDRT